MKHLRKSKMFMMMAIVRDRMKNSFSKNGFPSSRFLSPAVDPSFVIRGGGGPNTGIFLSYLRKLGSTCYH